MRRLVAIATGLALLCACLLSGCGDSVQSQALTASTLEPLVMAQHYPVYWLGQSFKGLALAGVSTDPSGAYNVQYGSCTTGGPETCISPLELISSPDNSFVPGAGARSASASIRGVKAVFAQGGKVIEVATGPAVIDVRAASRTLALAAARQMAPINELGSPGAVLPAAGPDTGFAQRPMEGQRPPAVQGLPAGK